MPNPPLAIHSYNHQYVIIRPLGRGDFGSVHLSKKQDQSLVAIKVFRNHENSKREVRIAKDICRKKLKGCAVLLDYGRVRDNRVTRELDTLLNSYFVVYEYIEKSFKDIYLDPNSSFTTQDLV